MAASTTSPAGRRRPTRKPRLAPLVHPSVHEAPGGLIGVDLHRISFSAGVDDASARTAISVTEALDMVRQVFEVLEARARSLVATAPAAPPRGGPVPTTRDRHIDAFASGGAIRLMFATGGPGHLAYTMTVSPDEGAGLLVRLGRAVTAARRQRGGAR